MCDYTVCMAVRREKERGDVWNVHALHHGATCIARIIARHRGSLKKERKKNIAAADIQGEQQEPPKFWLTYMFAHFLFCFISFCIKIIQFSDGMREHLIELNWIELNLNPKASRGLLHKTFTGEKALVKSENSGKHNLTIHFTIGKNRLKLPEFFSGKCFMQYRVQGPWVGPGQGSSRFALVICDACT